MCIVSPNPSHDWHDQRNKIGVLPWKSNVEVIDIYHASGSADQTAHGRTRSRVSCKIETHTTKSFAANACAKGGIKLGLRWQTIMVNDGLWRLHVALHGATLGAK